MAVPPGRVEEQLYATTKNYGREGWCDQRPKLNWAALT